MSDELVYNETKSLPVTHDSLGVVPVVHIHTVIQVFSCLCTDLLQKKKKGKKKGPFTNMFSDYKTRTALLFSCNH